MICDTYKIGYQMLKNTYFDRTQFSGENETHYFIQLHLDSRI
jgi:hypothetical protein